MIQSRRLQISRLICYGMFAGFSLSGSIAAGTDDAATTQSRHQKFMAGRYGNLDTPERRQQAAHMIVQDLWRDYQLAPGCGTGRAILAIDLASLDFDALPAIISGLQHPGLAQDLSRAVSNMTPITQRRARLALLGELDNGTHAYAAAVILLHHGNPKDRPRINKALHSLTSSSEDPKLQKLAEASLRSVEMSAGQQNTP